MKCASVCRCRSTYFDRQPTMPTTPKPNHAHQNAIAVRLHARNPPECTQKHTKIPAAARAATSSSITRKNITYRHYHLSFSPTRSVMNIAARRRAIVHNPRLQLETTIACQSLALNRAASALHAPRLRIPRKRSTSTIVRTYTRPNDPSLHAGTLHHYPHLQYSTITACQSHPLYQRAANVLHALRDAIRIAEASHGRSPLHAAL